MLYLVETFQKLPSDPFFEQMDQMEKMLLFYAWANKNNVELESMKNQAILIGAFSNLEMAQKMSRGPDYQLSEEEFDASYDYVQSQPMPEALQGISEEGNSRRRRRRVVN